VSDPDGSLGPNERLSFPLSLNETDRELELIVFSDHADLLQVDLVGPRGEHRDGGDERASKGIVVKRIRLPEIGPEDSLHGPHYSVVVSRPQQTPDLGTKVDFTFVAAAQSDLMLEAAATATEFAVGAELRFSVRLTEYGLPVREREGLSACVELRHPDGELETLQLLEASPGHFEGRRRGERAGVYTAHFVVTGRTLLQQRPFRREALSSVMLFEPVTTGPDVRPGTSQMGSIVATNTAA